MTDSAEGTPASTGNKGKSGKWLSKNKWYVIGGLAGIAILVFYFVNRSNSNAATSANTTTTTPATSPADTYGALGDYGGNYGLAGPAGATGATGPAGPAGKRGPRGPAGKAPTKHPVRHKKATAATATPHGTIGRQTAVHTSTAAHNARSGSVSHKPAIAHHGR